MPSWSGKVLFLTTLGLVVFYAGAYSMTSDLHWARTLQAPRAARAVVIPGVGILISMAAGAYWYGHRDRLSRRLALGWLLALFVALLGVPVACSALLVDQLRGAKWLVR